MGWLGLSWVGSIGLVGLGWVKTKMIGLDLFCFDWVGLAGMGHVGFGWLGSGLRELFCVGLGWVGWWLWYDLAICLHLGGLSWVLSGQVGSFWVRLGHAG